MDDFKLTNYLPSLQADALKKAIERKGSTVEEEVQAAMVKLYEELIPQSERDSIAEQMAMDEEEYQKDLDGYCLVQLHDKDDDCYFLLDEGVNAYTIASSYHNHVSRNVNDYDLNSLAQDFGEVDYLSEKVYESLVRAMPTDSNIRAALQFDFEKNVLRVCNGQEGEWKTYDFMDIGEAVDFAEEELDVSTIQKSKKFWADLEGRELNEETEAFVPALKQ